MNWIRGTAWALLVVGTGLVGCGESVTAAGSGPFVRVLGTVQDGGLPHASCHCDRCERARSDPQERRFVASLALVLPSTGRVFLIDATPDLHSQLDQLRDLRKAPSGRVDRAPVDGVFLTHAHIGHYLGLAFFGYEAIHTRALPVIATPRMAAYLQANGPWSQLVTLGNIELEEMAPGDSRDLGEGVTVTAFSAPHRDEYADTLGFVIHGPNRKLLYLPDTDSWTAWTTPLPETLRNIDVALLDGTFFSPQELPGRSVDSIGHPLIRQTLELLKEPVQQRGLEVYFTHLNHSNPALDPDSDERHEIETRGFHVLSEGQEIAL